MATTGNHVFEVTGQFFIEKNLKPISRKHYAISGFELPDGRIAKLIVGIEVTDTITGGTDYITDQQELEKLGFSCLDYDKTCFDTID